MWRTIIAVGASMVLSMAFLAACNGDETDNGVADDPAGIADDPEGDEVPVDDTATEEDDAATEDDETAVTDDTDDAVNDDDEVAEETYEVNLSDHEIDMDTTFEAGTVVFEVTNDGEVPHGIAIQEAAANGTMEAANNDDDDDDVTNDDDDENGEAETGELIAAITVDPGDTGQLEVEFEEGEYIVFCPIGEHRDEEGMEEEITVE